MDLQIADGNSAVVTCSALKRAYRAELLTGRSAATMVFLLEVRDRDHLARVVREVRRMSDVLRVVRTIAGQSHSKEPPPL